MDNNVDENVQNEELVNDTKAKSLEDVLLDDSLSDEEKRLGKALLENNMDANKIIQNEMDRIFIGAYKSFIEANLNRMKFMMTSIIEGEKSKNDFYNVVIDNITYKWKDELFIKLDEFDSTSKGKVEIYVLDYSKIKNIVDNMMPSLFNDVVESEIKGKEVSEEEKNRLYEVAKSRFLNSVFDLAERMRILVGKDYFIEKSNFADITIVDIIYDDHFIPYLLEASKKNISELNTNNRYMAEKLIKRIGKDFSRNGAKFKEEEKKSIDLLFSHMQELFTIVFRHNKKILNGENATLDSIVDEINKIEDTKEYKLESAKARFAILKSMQKAFNIPNNRSMIPALFASYANTSIEDTYLIKKYYDITTKLYNDNKDLVL